MSNEGARIEALERRLRDLDLRVSAVERGFDQVSNLVRLFTGGMSYNWAVGVPPSPWPSTMTYKLSLDSYATSYSAPWSPTLSAYTATVTFTKTGQTWGTGSDCSTTRFGTGTMTYIFSFKPTTVSGLPRYATSGFAWSCRADSETVLFREPTTSGGFQATAADQRLSASPTVASVGAIGWYERCSSDNAYSPPYSSGAELATCAALNCNCKWYWP